MLIEIHRSQTVARKACILPNLSKQWASTLEKRVTDNYLFGDNRRRNEIFSTQEKFFGTVVFKLSELVESTEGGYSDELQKSSFKETANFQEPTKPTSLPEVESISPDSSSESNTLNSKDEIASTSSSIKAYPGCRQAISEALINRGTPKEAVDIMIAPLEESTIKQYNGMLKLWWHWNIQCDENPLIVSSEKTLKFLTERFDNGIGHSSLNSAKAALSLISNENIGGNQLISRFIKGSSKIRSSLPKYDETWDVDPVLDNLSSWFPLDSLSLKKLTEKLVVLLALGTAHRAQTLSLIKISNINTLETRIEIRISDRIKISKKGKVQPVLKIPFFREKPELCIANTLNRYLEVTKDKRNGNDSLFISYQSPFKEVKSETISRWIRSALVDLGVDKKFTAHSTRHASTSKAFEKGVSIEEIKKVAGWSGHSQTFAKFYQQPIRLRIDSFASTVLNAF
ncbi:GSCOCG00006045001-RA-CDS [Cotesia congregata]|nr:GSCOCG00006045001-RA-CDS [Cotesia congregata]